MARLSDLVRPGALAGDITAAVVVTAVAFVLGTTFGIVTAAVATGWLLVIHLPDREERSDQGPRPGR